MTQAQSWCKPDWPTFNNWAYFNILGIFLPTVDQPFLQLHSIWTSFQRFWLFYTSLGARCLCLLGRTTAAMNPYSKSESSESSQSIVQFGNCFQMPNWFQIGLEAFFGCLNRFQSGFVRFTKSRMLRILKTTMFWIDFFSFFTYIEYKSCWYH